MSQMPQGSWMTRQREENKRFRALCIAEGRDTLACVSEKAIAAGVGPFMRKVDTRLPAKAKEAARAEALVESELLQDLNPRSVAIGAIVALSLWVLLS